MGLVQVTKRFLRSEAADLCIAWRMGRGRNKNDGTSPTLTCNHEAPIVFLARKLLRLQAKIMGRMRVVRFPQLYELVTLLIAIKTRDAHQLLRIRYNMHKLGEKMMLDRRVKGGKRDKFYS